MNHGYHVNWINVAKTCAMGGVLIEHVNGIFYSDQKIYRSTWYCVALFVFLTGYGIMESWERNQKIFVKKRLLKISAAYLIATIFYILLKDGFLDFGELIYYLLHFNASGPFYYVWVYMQLIMISPILVCVILWVNKGKSNFARHILVLLSIMCICFYTSNYTKISDIPCGGGYFLGGPWLFLWYLGMAFQSRLYTYIRKEPSKIIFWLSLLLLILWEYIFVVKNWAYQFPSIFHSQQLGTNWADILQMVLLVVMIKEGTGLTERKNNFFAKLFIDVGNFIGERTLYIFLYHMFFLQVAKLLIPCSLMWTKRIIWGGIMLGGPIALGYVFEVIEKWYKLSGVTVD